MTVAELKAKLADMKDADNVEIVVRTHTKAYPVHYQAPNFVDLMYGREGETGYPGTVRLYLCLPEGVNVSKRKAAR